MTLPDALQTIADATLDTILPTFGIGGPTWTRTRLTGDGVTADRTSATASVTGARAVPNAGSKLQQAAAGVGVFASDWLIMGEPDTDLADQDVITDGEYTFRLTGAPATTLGYLLAPAEIIA